MTSRLDTAGPRHDVVVGVMARAPLPGRCKTRLARTLGDEGAAELYRAMLLDTLAAYAELPVARLVVLAAPEADGVRYLRELVPPGWDVVPQRGAGLGERLAAAQAELRPGAVLLVSSDSPNPPLSALSDALTTWPSRSEVLLGPCDDGGYYLIGLPCPETRLFEGIPWSTARVLGETTARCRELDLPMRLLPPAVDVDEVADMNRLRAELTDDPIHAPRTKRLLSR